MLFCVVKLPDEVCVGHTKRVGENKTVSQLEQFAEVLLTGLTLKKCCHFSVKLFFQLFDITDDPAASKTSRYRHL